MGIGKDGLNRNEEVVLKLRPHWWYFARQTTALFGAIGLAIVVLAADLPNFVGLAAAALVLAALGWFLVRYVVWVNIWFVITTDRIIRRSGVFKRQGIEIPLERINTVLFRQTIFQRIIGAGDLEIESASEEGSQPIDSIRRPLNVQNEIYKQIEDNENRKFDRIGAPAVSNSTATVPVATDPDRTERIDPPTQTDPPTAGPANSKSIPNQIEQLARLARDGILTDQEFQNKKRELLDRM